MPMEAAMGTVTVMLLSAGLLLLGFFFGWLISSKVAQSRIYRAEGSAEKILEDAQKEAEEMKRTATLESKDQMHQERLQVEQVLDEKREQVKISKVKLGYTERQLDKRADLLNHKDRSVASRELEINQLQEKVESKARELDLQLVEQNLKLEEIAGLSKDEGLKLLLKNLEGEAKEQAVWRIKKIREEALTRANGEAQEIIANAIQRLASDHTVESTVSVVNLPSDEMKGRIIGREGRNIRAFETMTGVDVIVDDTPEAVVLSGFDPIRRAVAKMALEQLILDGRIHPGRIEEIVTKSHDSMQDVIRAAGEQVAFDLGVPGLHARLIVGLGRLKYLTSYGQNLLSHSKEVAFLAGMMAAQLGLDVQVAKRAGLLHDISKGLTHEAEGTLGQNGSDLLRKYGEDTTVVNAIEAHHGISDPVSPIAVLVDSAETISRSRPGARREVLENYVRRLDRLESLARNIQGVDQAYAIQAGQEIRVVADCDLISDEDTEKLAIRISQQLEEGMTYPGPVKITVIREVRAIDYAK